MILVPFGNENTPEEAYATAEAFLHMETKDDYETNVRKTETEKADELRKKQIRASLPGGSPPKPTPPANPQEAYVSAIRQAGVVSNPDSWF
jgi:hypothetical protein